VRTGIREPTWHGATEKPPNAIFLGVGMFAPDSSYVTFALTLENHLLVVMIYETCDNHNYKTLKQNFRHYLYSTI